MTGCLDAEAAADLLAQRMPENERRAAEEHLDGCATCRRFIAALAREHFEEQRGEESKNIKRNVPADEEEDSSASFDSLARAFRSGQKLGRYLLLDIAGTGAMGSVFSAYDPELDRKVALNLKLNRRRHRWHGEWTGCWRRAHANHQGRQRL